MLVRKEQPAADPAYAEWLDAVAGLTRKYLGVELDALPELPLRDGFEVGDTPAEFYVAAVIDAAELVGHSPR